MDCGALRGPIPALEALPASSARGRRLLRLQAPAGIGFPAGLAVDVQGVAKFGGKRCSFVGRHRRFVTIASAEFSNKCESRSHLRTPLEPESAAGKFLCGVLNDHPHIFAFAAAEQLRDLALQRQIAVARRDHSLGSAESNLHERIAQMKHRECQIAVEEVLYMLIVHRFFDIKVPMVPRLSKFMDRTLDLWSSKDKELEAIHSNEVLEMVREHLSNVLGWTGMFDMSANLSKAHIKRLQLGRIYAASIMYGYFLKSACLRHHLEYNFALTSKDYPLSYLVQMPGAQYVQCKLEQNSATLAYPKEATSFYPATRARNVKKLRSYVIGFDSSTLQICAKLKSQEAVNLIEKHSRALLLDFKDVNLEDEAVPVTYRGLRHLVLEAVAFGSFLWDAERYVDSIYSLEEH